MGEDSKIENPELVFGIVGPIGVNLDHVVASLDGALKEVGYKPRVVHLTSVMMEAFSDLTSDETSYSKRYRRLIKNADTVRERAENPAAMAGLAISEIKRLRQEANASPKGQPEEPSLGTAYILRQFKRAEEIALLREVYGRKFIQLSVFLDRDERQEQLIKKIREFNTQIVDEADAEKQAIDLIDIDNKEKNEYGQRVSDVFHLGDVFVKGDGKSESKETIRRFILALFGDNGISPTKYEYGLYAAAGAALRSIDLSRQIGAAIFSVRGEIISLGCNEVPKPFGGTYWTDDSGELARDFELRRDGNQDRKARLLHDLVERVEGLGVLSDKLMALQDTGARVHHLLSLPAVADSRMMDIIEFGRMIHAEMSALTDAARLGRSVDGAILFCTTFPCHICAKHIVAAGIRRVVFLEPYPKSHAKDLHSDSITFSPAERDKKVLFEPFIGISPRRYRDIFEKGKRKDGNGKARIWAEGKPVPRVEDKSSSYLENEEPAISLTITKLFKLETAPASQ